MKKISSKVRGRTPKNNKIVIADDEERQQEGQGEELIDDHDVAPEILKHW
jgi:hypothetical protein